MIAKMKLLYCILAIVVAANAAPEPPTQEDLKSIADRILQQIQDAPQRIDKVIADTNVIVTEKLLENPYVNKTKVALNDKLSQILANGSEDLDEESQRILDVCGVSIIESFNKLVIDVSNELLQKVLAEKLKKDNDFLNTLRKDLSAMKDGLENYLEEEIEICLNEKTKCRLTGEFLLKSEEYFNFVDIIEPTLHLKIEASNDFFNSFELGHIIITKFSKPAYDCLNPDKA